MIPMQIHAEIEALAAISSHPSPAVTRVLFSDEDMAARRWITGLFEAEGLVVRADAVGNLFARWCGVDSSLPAFATGSHIDAIPNAGRFDGVLGVLGAIQAVRMLRSRGFQPLRSLEIIMFTAEEPTRYGLGCLGSRLLGGAIDPDVADALVDSTGQSLHDLRVACGYDGSLSNVPLSAGFYDGFIELHMEQGPILERENVDIGIVEKIAAPAAFRVFLEGEGGHAGAVLMPGRRDACLAAAEIALAVERSVLDSGSDDTVGTTGVFQIKPGAINSVPCSAVLEIDLRDTELKTRDFAEVAMRREAEAICARRSILMQWETINSDSPAICDPAIISEIEAACESTGFSQRRMISRAYHDSLFIANVVPTAMVFVPCREGWSHRPDEFVEPSAVEAGVSVLAEVLAARLSR